MTHLETIREKCIAANPEIGDIKVINYTGPKDDDSLKNLAGKITLANVLLALKQWDEKWDIRSNHPDRNLHVLRIVNLWNLLKDDLSLQTPETQEFIAKLLS